MTRQESRQLFDLDVEQLRMEVDRYLSEAGQPDERSWIGRASRRDLWAELVYVGFQNRGSLSGSVNPSQQPAFVSAQH